MRNTMMVSERCPLGAEPSPLNTLYSGSSLLMPERVSEPTIR